MIDAFDELMDGAIPAAAFGRDWVSQCATAQGRQRAERLPDCLSTPAHRFWICAKATLHGLEQMLRLPMRNSPLSPRCALRFGTPGIAGEREGSAKTMLRCADHH
jgi:hypothetical protein